MNMRIFAETSTTMEIPTVDHLLNEDHHNISYIYNTKMSEID